MKKLFIKSTYNTPRVFLNGLNGVSGIEGNSISEDAVRFYKPVIEWLDEYARYPNMHTIFVFNLNYFNSASLRIIRDILFTLSDIKQKGYLVDIIWCYQNEDDHIYTTGKEYAELVEISFQFIPRTKAVSYEMTS
jgi:hypothetical protein